MSVSMFTLFGLPWTRCVSRKRARCVACQNDIHRGSECGRPLREGIHILRNDRVCIVCLTTDGKPIEVAELPQKDEEA